MRRGHLLRNTGVLQRLSRERRLPLLSSTLLEWDVLTEARPLDVRHFVRLP